METEEELSKLTGLCTEEQICFTVPTLLPSVQCPPTPTLHLPTQQTLKYCRGKHWVRPTPGKTVIIAIINQPDTAGNY